MPRSKEYEVEVRFSGYVTVQVRASTPYVASKKAQKAVRWEMGMKPYKGKHGPEITDDFHDVDDVTSVEEVGNR